ncbi:hypothetical protein A9F13_14g01507 [Clavispora lusitaniae]|uniref:Uncharacterized protein n=1 Tax=Clavispora lusitaniae TaxID=36911 RepID=A0AA91T0P7_CLALS|nr:hypothetical protein A9F13_14g01507 [Clavispora lusitaniae]
MPSQDAAPPISTVCSPSPEPGTVWKSSSPGASFATVSTTSRHGNVGRLQDGSGWASLFPWTSLFPWPSAFVSELLGYLRHIHSGTTGGLTNAFVCYKIAD